MIKNFFSRRSLFFEFRWYILFLLFVMAVMVWYDARGGRMFSSESQEQFSSSGPGYHK